MDQLNSTSLKLPWVVFPLSFASYIWQVTAAALMPVKIWRDRKASGFSIAFQCLCIMSFMCKYVYNERTDQWEIPSFPNRIYAYQYVTKIQVLMCMVAALCISLARGNWKFEDEFEKWCIPVGLIVSFLLGTDGRNETTTKIGLWTIGSYLELIAWIAQLKLSLKRRPIDLPVMSFILSMFIYDILNDTGFSYDFYRNSLYKNVGYNLSFLKFLLFCGFFLKYWVGTPRIENNSNATTVQPTPSALPASKKKLGPKKDSEKLTCCIRVEDNVPMNKQQAV